MDVVKNQWTVKRFSLIVMAVFYLAAGINHFVHPHSYYVLIPPYVPFPVLINIVSGMFEIIFGAMLLVSSTRQAGALGLVILLILFIPVHIYMIQKGGCMSVTFCIPAWLVWVRLFPVQFILIAWARWYAK